MSLFQRLFLLFLAVSLPAWAEVTLRVPIAVEGYKKKSLTSMEEINEILKTKKLPAQPTHFVLKQGDKTDYYEQSAKIEKVMQKARLKNATVITELFPNEHGQDGLSTCFTGQGTAVAELAASKTDAYYSEQMNIHGWKFGNKTWVADQEWTPETLARESKEWREYDPQSDTVLILTAVGDDGTDVNVSVIERCN